MARGMRGSSWMFRRGRTVYTGRSRSDSFCGQVVSYIFLGLVLVGIPSGLFYAEYQQRQLEIAFEELESQIVQVDTSDSSGVQHVPEGTPVYFTSGFKASVSDDEFGLTLDNGLLLNRETQYCQWLETSSESCDTCENSDGSTYRCHCTTTYYYNKGWRNHRIISSFFDQPFNHNNPQRDPYPSVALPSTNAAAGQVSIDPELLTNTRGQARRVMFKHPSQPKPKYFWSELFGWKDNQRYEHTDSLQQTMSAPAYLQDGFVFTGEEGFFFSPYEPSMAGSLFKKFGQYLEGSLFDWQLADIFDTGCTAGDIRVRYSVVDPASVSVVGKLVKDPSPHVVSIDNLKKASISVGLVHAGTHDYEDMVDAENSIANQHSNWMRLAVLFIWAPTAYFVGALRTPVSAGGAAVLLIGGCWASLYGVTDFSGVSTSIVTIFVTMIGAVLLVVGQAFAGPAEGKKRF